MVGHVPAGVPASGSLEDGVLHCPCEQSVTVPSHVAPGFPYVSATHFNVVVSHAVPTTQSDDAAHVPPAATAVVQTSVSVPVQTSGDEQF
jgi:hypothetical protein